MEQQFIESKYLLVLLHYNFEILISFRHHKILLSFRHHEILLSFRHHEILLSFGHHEILLSFGHHEILLSFGHHEILLSFGHQSTTIIKISILTAYHSNGENKKCITDFKKSTRPTCETTRQVYRMSGIFVPWTLIFVI